MGVALHAPLDRMKLPDPLIAAHNSSETVSATAWANLTASPGLVTLALPRRAVVQVNFAAWLAISSTTVGSTIRAGVSHNGGAPNALFGGSWGNVIYTQQYNVSINNGAQHAMTAVAALAAGTHTFQAQAYRTGSGGACACSYWALNVAALRWAD